MRVRRVVLTAFGLFAAATGAGAQVRVNPTGVSVSSMSATTVFLTYGGLRNQRAVDARWCGELVSAAPAVGLKCDPSTVYGELPARYDLSRPGATSLTDVMSIPASVSRLAYQAAERGATSTFFYVRRFVSASGAADEYVAVTCRLTGGGARSPFSLTDVHLQFGGDDALPFVAPGEAPPPITARIAYTGTGRLVGRWEVVLPGEEPPSSHDLLTEASLPPDERGTQRRFTELERFNIFLAPDGHVTLPGPDLRRLPTNAEGTYRVLLRVEASDDRESDSNLDDAGAGTGIVHSGAVAGFALPTLRYIVAGSGARTGAVEAQGSSGLHALGPRDGDALDARSAFVVRWAPGPSGGAAADFYHVEFENEQDVVLFSALLPRAARRYEPPEWVAAQAREHALRWRVTGLAADGAHLTSTDWRAVRIVSTLPAAAPARNGTAGSPRPSGAIRP
jgi:hypothetical protein